MSTSSAPSALVLEIVAPERLLVSREVAMVTVPGEAGEFGVLPGHAPLVSSLRMGVLDIYNGPGTSSVSERIFISGGFAEVSDNRLTVLAQEAVPLAELDRAALEAAIRKAQDELVVAQGEEATAALQAQIALAGAKLALLAGTGGGHT